MKNLGLFGFFLFLLVVFGCRGHVGLYQWYIHDDNTSLWTQVFPVYVDKQFGEADKLSIHRALEQWNFAMNGNAKFQVISDRYDMRDDVLRQAYAGNVFVILKVDSSNPVVKPADRNSRNIVAQDGGRGGFSIGFTNDTAGHLIYLVRDRLQNEDVFYITLHELGHALGAEHDAGGLMYRYYYRDRWRCVDWLAIRQVALHYRWKIETVNYCASSESSKSSVRAQPLAKGQQSGQALVNVVGR